MSTFAVDDPPAADSFEADSNIKNGFDFSDSTNGCQTDPTH